MKHPISSSIVLNGLELHVNLGWPEKERIQKQIIVTDIEIRFSEPPQGCITDKLSDTYCYDALIKEIKSHIGEREFRLLEHLVYEVYQLIKKNVENKALVLVRATKKPAISNLTGGVSFCYGDKQ